MPRFGECWTSALRRLDAGCRSLTDEEQARMALHFARCFLAKSGRDHPECEEEETVAECLRGADNVAFNAYTAFFTVRTEEISLDWLPLKTAGIRISRSSFKLAHKYRLFPLQ